MMKSLLGRLRFTARQELISQSHHQHIHRCLFSTQHGDSPTLQKFAVRLDVFARIVVQGGGFSFSRSSNHKTYYNDEQNTSQRHSFLSSLLPSFSLFLFFFYIYIDDTHCYIDMTHYYIDMTHYYIDIDAYHHQVRSKFLFKITIYQDKT